MVAGTVFFSDDQQPLMTISSTTINEAKDGSYLNASVQICIATTVVNVAAFVVIRRKEKTGVNGLIVTDCLANILTAMVQLLDNLPSSTSRYVAPVFCICLLTNKYKYKQICTKYRNELGRNQRASSLWSSSLSSLPGIVSFLLSLLLIATSW